MDIKQALAMLDPENDAHWTKDGQPAVEAVSQLVGSQVTRQQITDAAPSLTRSPAESGAPDAGDQPDTPTAEAGDQPPADAPPAAEQPPQAPPPVIRDVDPSSVRSALDIPIHQVLRSRDLCQQVLEELTQVTTGLLEERGKIDTKLAQCNEYAQAIDRALARITKEDPNRAMVDIRAYLERGARTRQERADRLKALTDRGIDPADLAAVAGAQTPLERAMQPADPTMRRPQFVPPPPGGGQ